MKKLSLNISLNIGRIVDFFENYAYAILVMILTAISVFCFFLYFDNGLGLAYNDARSHLDIGRRVVEGLKPGFAQLGSVWLPLPHLLMVPTIWNDYMWHSGLAGALQSMLSFVATGMLIFYYLKKLNVPVFIRYLSVLIFVANINVLYMQSVAMTELLLLATMTAASFEFLLWFQGGKITTLIRMAFWVMLSTLIRYDGWFLFFFICVILVSYLFKKHSFKKSEGFFFFYCTLAGFGIFLWFLWNLVIFKDPLYFAFGPFSAHAQQLQLEDAGVLVTKGNLLFSARVYLYALVYNSGAFHLFLALIGAIVLWFDRKQTIETKLASLALFAPLIFNIVALYLGHSVLFVQGLSGNTWFNARYGLMMMPSIAIFIGYLLYRIKKLRYIFIFLLLVTSYYTFVSRDAVTIDDARVGSSQKNVTEVSGWLKTHAKDKKGFVLISAASHDAIIFSSGLPMKRFIHEGTGAYWDSAVLNPDRWARWIVMRTNDNNDLTFRSIKSTPGFKRFIKVDSYPFADIYELDEKYVKDLITDPILGKQR